MRILFRQPPNRNTQNTFKMIYLCHGSSMLPTFSKLGLVRIKKSKEYKTGDIISLKTLDKKYHCHRIVEINNQWVSTKGDNLEQQWYEIQVPLKNIGGKVIWSYPKKRLR